MSHEYDNNILTRNIHQQLITNIIIFNSTLIKNV